MEEAEDRTATMRVWIALIFVVVLMPSVAAGPATMPAEPTPSRIIKCDAQGLTLVGLSEDGGSVYYAETVDEANVWRILSYYWPECFCVMAAVPLLVWVRRVVRRGGQDVGEEYCRKCNYMLRGLTSSQCPECGLELTPAQRVHGRRMRARIALPVVLAVTLIGAYAVGRSRVHRLGRFSDWFDWPTMHIRQWASDWRFRSPDAFRQTVVFSTNVAAGGERTRVARIRHDGITVPWSWQLVPGDQRRIVCRLGSRSICGIITSIRDDIVQVDVTSRREVRYDGRTFLRGPFGLDYAARQTIFIWESAGVRAFDMQSGASIGEFPCRSEDVSILPATVGGVDVALIATPANADRWHVRLWNPTAARPVEWSFDAAFRSGICDGDRLYLCRWNNPGVTLDIRDIHTGAPVDTLTLPGISMAWLNGVSANLLLLDVWDVQDRKGRLLLDTQHPERGLWIARNGRDGAILSPNGRTLAIADPSNGGMIRIYDLPACLERPERGLH